MFISMNFLAICHIFRICSLQEVLNVHCVNGSLHGVEWFSCQQLGPNIRSFGFQFSFHTFIRSVANDEKCLLCHFCNASKSGIEYKISV